MKYSVLYPIQMLAMDSSFISTTCRTTSIYSVKINPNPRIAKGHIILSDRRFLQINETVGVSSYHDLINMHEHP